MTYDILLEFQYFVHPRVKLSVVKINCLWFAKTLFYTAELNQPRPNIATPMYWDTHGTWKKLCMTSQSTSYFPTSHPVPWHLTVAEVNYGTVLPTVHCTTKYPYSLLQRQFRAQELCESRGGRSGLPVPTSKDSKLRSLLSLLIVCTVSTCGLKATLISDSKWERNAFQRLVLLTLSLRLCSPELLKWQVAE